MNPINTLKMKLFKYLVLIPILLITTVNYGQDYFIVETDTTFVSNLEYGTTIQGYLKSLRYTDSNGKEIAIEGRKEVPDVSTMYRQGTSIDRIPQKPDRPNSYTKFVPRAVDGKLKIYIKYPNDIGSTLVRSNAPNPLTANNSTMSRNQNGSLETMSGRTGVYYFYIKFPDGTFYKVNKKKNMKKYIIPYLKECAQFNEQYNGDFSAEEEDFIKMIELYNTACK